MVNMRLVFLGTSAGHRLLIVVSHLLRYQEETNYYYLTRERECNEISLESKLGMNRKMKIFVTHMHADYCVGLLGLLQTMSLQGRQTCIDVYGQTQLSNLLKKARES